MDTKWLWVLNFPPRLLHRSWNRPQHSLYTSPDTAICCGGKTNYCLRRFSIPPAHDIVSISTELSRLFKTEDRSVLVLGYRAPPGADDLVLVHTYSTTVCQSSGAISNDSLTCVDTFVTITSPLQASYLYVNSIGKFLWKILRKVKRKPINFKNFCLAAGHWLQVLVKIQRKQLLDI
jgi:hypothetical protein